MTKDTFSARSVFEEWLHSQEFYELCQSYRHASSGFAGSNQEDVINAFERLKLSIADKAFPLSERTQWIPTSERQPSEWVAGMHYLVWFQDRWSVLEYDPQIGWLWGDGSYMSHQAQVTHWMDLPPAPTNAAPQGLGSASAGDGSAVADSGAAIDGALESVSSVKSPSPTSAGAAPERADKEQAHNDHPARHFDRTCPACIAEEALTPPSERVTNNQSDFETLWKENRMSNSGAEIYKEDVRDILREALARSSTARVDTTELKEAFQDLLDEAPLDFVGTGSQASGDIKERQHIERVQRVFRLIDALAFSARTGGEGG